MEAGEAACYCAECQTVCSGHFSGCSDVWARGPVAVALVSAPAPALAPPVAPAGGDLPPSADHPAMPARAYVPEAARAEVLDWMRTAFDGLRGEIRVLTDTVARQQSTLAELAEARQAELRVVELADTLPDRLGNAIAAAIGARQEAYVARVDDVVSNLGVELARTLPARLGTAIADAIEERQEALLSRVDQTSVQLRIDLAGTLTEALSVSLPKRVGTATAAAIHARHEALVEHIEELATGLGTRLAASMVEQVAPVLMAAAETNREAVADQVRQATAEVRASLAALEPAPPRLREVQASGQLHTTPGRSAFHPAAPQAPHSVEQAVDRAVSQVLDRAVVAAPAIVPPPAQVHDPRPRPRSRPPAGSGDLATAKRVLRERVSSALAEAKVSRFPGTEGRIPNFIGAEDAAERLRRTDPWTSARTLKSNPDAPQWPVRERALTDGKLLYMAVPRLAAERPFFLLDPAELTESARRASSIRGAARFARSVGIDELPTIDLIVTGCVAVGEDGARLGKGGGYSDLELAILTEIGCIGPDTTVVTTAHELQVVPAGTVPMGPHDLWVDLVVTPDRLIRCEHAGDRPPASISWDQLGDDQLSAMPVLAALHDS